MAKTPVAFMIASRSDGFGGKRPCHWTAARTTGGAAGAPSETGGLGAASHGAPLVFSTIGAAEWRRERRPNSAWYKNEVFLAVVDKELKS